MAFCRQSQSRQAKIDERTNLTFIPSEITHKTRNSNTISNRKPRIFVAQTASLCSPSRDS